MLSLLVVDARSMDVARANLHLKPLYYLCIGVLVHHDEFLPIITRVLSFPLDNLTKKQQPKTLTGNFFRVPVVCHDAVTLKPGKEPLNSSKARRCLEGFRRLTLTSFAARRAQDAAVAKHIGTKVLSVKSAETIAALERRRDGDIAVVDVAVGPDTACGRRHLDALALGARPLSIALLGVRPAETTRTRLALPAIAWLDECVALPHRENVRAAWQGVLGFDLAACRAAPATTVWSRTCWSSNATHAPRLLARHARERLAGDALATAARTAHGACLREGFVLGERRGLHFARVRSLANLVPMEVLAHEGRKLLTCC
eukprot:PhM_4_TR18068/c4_g2_i3/m.101958